MAIAQFEETQYECAFNNEPYAGGPVFPSGQVLESVTGYDSSAAPNPTITSGASCRRPAPRAFGWCRRTGPLP